MTTATYKHKQGWLTVESDGRVSVDVRIENFVRIDGTFHALAEEALQNPEVPVIIPNNGVFVPRPRNSRVHSIAQ